MVIQTVAESDPRAGSKGQLQLQGMAQECSLKIVASNLHVNIFDI